MPFVLSQKQSYTWPVKYRAPRGDGKTDEFEFTAEFRRVSQSRFVEMLQQIEAKNLTDNDLIDEVLIDWNGIKGTDGQDFTYNDTNKQILLDLLGMPAAIVGAFFDSLRGAPRKN